MLSLCVCAQPGTDLRKPTKGPVPAGRQGCLPSAVRLLSVGAHCVRPLEDLAAMLPHAGARSAPLPKGNGKANGNGGAAQGLCSKSLGCAQETPANGPESVFEAHKQCRISVIEHNPGPRPTRQRQTATTHLSPFDSPFLECAAAVRSVHVMGELAARERITCLCRSSTHLRKSAKESRRPGQAGMPVLREMSVIRSCASEH